MTRTRTSPQVPGLEVANDHTTFLDVLQATPQLLKTFEAALDLDGLYRSSIKTLRLVSRQARAAAPKAVTGYCMQISPQAIPTQPLPRVIALLCEAPLRRLRVDITVPPGEVNLELCRL